MGVGGSGRADALLATERSGAPTLETDTLIRTTCPRDCCDASVGGKSEGPASLQTLRRPHHDLGADVHLVEQLRHILVQHADAAGGD